MNKTQGPRRSRGRSPKRTKSAAGNVQSNGRSRGNPKQLVDKYKSLARDAMQAGDRVLSEYYLQHADHYQRLLNERMGPAEDSDDETDRAEADGDARSTRRRGRGQRARNAGEPDQPAVDPRGEDSDPRRGDQQDDDGEQQAAADGAVGKEPDKPRRRRAPRKAAEKAGPDAQADGPKAEAIAD